jgi:hypothetical protein
MAESSAPITSNGPELDRNNEKAMALFFPSTDPLSESRTFSERDCDEIRRLLRCLGKPSWSILPRIYIVLRTINQLNVMDDFVAIGVTDIWLPFSEASLPEALKSPSARRHFLETQKIVLFKGLDLEKGSEGKHRHFKGPDELPFHIHEELGRGGFGVVDRVTSTLSSKTYARKRLFRGRTFQQDRQTLLNFERELTALKRVSHTHIVELVGSYTDPKFVGLVMSPVADEDLRSYMKVVPLDRVRKSHLAGFFGCLATALTYLHDNSIRHKVQFPSSQS